MHDRKIITTSWDDGHPLDLKLADLLHKYNLNGTFYIPRANRENRVMKEVEIRDLAQRFEIGGHTLNHIRLNVNKHTIRTEIEGCYSWLSDVLPKPPSSFCFPGGVYNRFALECARKSGFNILRTTGLLSIDGPDESGLLPTTLQVYEHSGVTYIGHLIKRMRLTDLFLLFRNFSDKGIVGLTQAYVQHINQYNGIFHLWGHSWEIEKYQLWNRMELIFKSLATFNQFDYLQNSELVS